MMNRREIYHSAMAPVAECGGRARLRADLKRIELGRSGNKDGAAVWARIGQVIVEIQEIEWQTRHSVQPAMHVRCYRKKQEYTGRRGHS